VSDARTYVSAGAHPTPLLQFSISADTISSRVRLAGELDQETCCLLSSVIDGQLAQRHVDLTIDVSRLTFIGLAGLYALKDAQRRLRAHGGRLTVVGYGRLLAEMADVCGMQDLLA
jgi:anti-anti-sigma factor